MAKFTFDHQPKLRLLSNEEILLVNQNALEVLERAGAFFDSEEALQILKENGCNVDFEAKS